MTVCPSQIQAAETLLLQFTEPGAGCHGGSGSYLDAMPARRLPPLLCRPRAALADLLRVLLPQPAEHRAGGHDPGRQQRAEDRRLPAQALLPRLLRASALL